MHEYQKKLVLIASIIICFIMPLFLITYYDLAQIEERPYKLNNDYLKVNDFSKDDYDPIIETDKLSHGNITVVDLDFDESGITNDSTNYAILDDDLASGGLIVSYDSTEFIKTITVAQIDNLDEKVEDSFFINVLLNDTITVEYNKSLAPLNGFLIYGSRLAPCSLTKLLYLNTSSSSVDEVSENYYSTDQNDYLVFDYDDFFIDDYKQFELYLIWEYEILIDEWNLEQINEEIFISKDEQIINPLFEYNFTVARNKVALNISEGIIEATNLDLYLRLSPADKEELFDHSLKVGENFISNYLNTDNSLNISIVSNINQVSLNYTANFTIKFKDPIESSWAIDRLVSQRNIRERIYFPCLTEAPQHHVVSNLYIYEETITIDQVISNTSLFERNVLVFDINLTVVEEDLRYSLIITRNSIKKKGLKIFIPFLIEGECNPYIIKYDANNNLKIIIADNIYMPLSGIAVEFYYYGKAYGTYISNEKVIPISPILSDENGEVILNGIPNGNYTLKLYQDNQLLTEITIDTFTPVNYIATEIVHFPLWIILFGLINGILFLIGLIVHNKYKKRM